jgi:myo-inositol-1-phosphate synthase
MTIDESAAEPVDIVAALKAAEADVLVSYLPVGSEEADKFYAQCAIDAGVAFVNALPVFIASPTPSGRRSSSRPVCRSSATTSRARSARRSPTG